MIGYEFLLSKIPLRMAPLSCPAQIKPVTRIERLSDLLAVPRHVAPAPDAGILEHALFALKHETLQLGILHEALKLVTRQQMLDALQAQPNGAYLRRAAFVWEKSHGAELAPEVAPATGTYIDMFDRQRYYTGQIWERNNRFRVNFNGIGPYEYCPVVLRDKSLEERGAAILQGLKGWLADPANTELLDRVVSWAYLSETRDSYAIENETPSPDKERAFMSAMEHLRDRTPLDEDYLVRLQNALISRPEMAEAEFRPSQNWLQRGGRGALAVRYLPPPPQALLPLMEGLMRMANARDEVPPLIKAAVVSFGFVFLHPFMDGNGRLSRLLAHHSLAYHGALPNEDGRPAILPLSVAMKRDEKGYLEALESFSKPARALWDVTFVDFGQYDFEFRSSPAAYAHWPAQQAVEFVTRCAESALAQTLVEETAFLQAYDQAFERIARLDLPDRSINLLIHWIWQNGGKLPGRRRNAQELAMLKPQELESVEAIVAEAFKLRPDG